MTRGDDESAYEERVIFLPSAIAHKLHDLRRLDGKTVSEICADALANAIGAAREKAQRDKDEEIRLRARREQVYAWRRERRTFAWIGAQLGISTQRARELYRRAQAEHDEREGIL